MQAAVEPKNVVDNLGAAKAMVGEVDRAEEAEAGVGGEKGAEEAKGDGNGGMAGEARGMVEVEAKGVRGTGRKEGMEGG